MKTASFCIVLFMALFFFSCEKQEKICIEQRKAAEIVGVQYPETVRSGENAIIRLDVDVPDSLCVRDAESWIENSGKDTFRIRSRIVYSDGGNGCSCTDKKVLNTIVLFNTSVTGSFYFIINDEWNLGSGSSKNFVIRCEQ